MGRPNQSRSKYRMRKLILKSPTHATVAFIEIEPNGVHRILDANHRVLGHFDPRTNRTTDCSHKLVGYGYLLPALLSAGVSEAAGTRGPQAPQSPEQAKRASDRKAKVNDRISDEQRRHKERLDHLRDELANGST